MMSEMPPNESIIGVLWPDIPSQNAAKATTSPRKYATRNPLPIALNRDWD